MTNIITEKKQTIDIPEGKQKERIDSFLTQAIENSTRSKIQKLIKAGFVIVNGKPIKANYKVVPFDKIEVTIPISPRPENAEPENIPLSIIYEDDYLLIVNKPAGMVVHPAHGNYTGTLVNALLYYTKQLSDYNQPDRPGIVHRIDKDTSGLLVVAKDEWTHAQLAKQFAKHITQREYWAVVWGTFRDYEGEINANIARSKKDRKLFWVSENEGKTAQTSFSVLEEFEFTSLLKLKLTTGRTHQIRVHLSSINHPIFGDASYGGKKIVYGNTLPKMKTRIDNLLKIMPRQALHAKTLGFFHPHKKEQMLFESELPEDFKSLIEKLR